MFHARGSPRPQPQYGRCVPTHAMHACVHTWASTDVGLSCRESREMLRAVARPLEEAAARQASGARTGALG